MFHLARPAYQVNFIKNLNVMDSILAIITAIVAAKININANTIIIIHELLFFFNPIYLIKEKGI